MSKIFPELPHWHSDMDEVSAGVYEVVGRDSAGHSVSAKGIDLDVLLEKCRQEAPARLEKQRRSESRRMLEIAEGKRKIFLPTRRVRAVFPRLDCAAKRASRGAGLLSPFDSNGAIEFFGIKEPPGFGPPTRMSCGE